MCYDEWEKSRFKIFNGKIEAFKDHPKYASLRKQADDAIRYYSGFGYAAIAAEDFIERIEAMPLDYIRDWLGGKNELKWRDCDKKMLDAMRGGYTHLLEKYNRHTIHRIAARDAHFYKDMGYDIINEDDNVYAVREET